MEASSSRFGTSDEADILHILADKDAENTKKATKAALNVFNNYLLATDREQLNFNTQEELCDDLCKFYADARKKDGQLYKLSPLKGIRFGLSRHFQKEMNVNIIKDQVFNKANDIFKAVTVRLKRQGLGKTDHTPAMEEDDLTKLYGSVALNTGTPCGLQHKVWFDIMFFLYRRGRENLRNMTKTTFDIARDCKGREYVYQVQDELDKNHWETDDTITEAHIYAVPGNRMCPVTSYKKYFLKLHPGISVLLQRPVDDFTDTQDIWNQKQALGKNTLADLMRTISKLANLSREFINHSIRATSISVLDIGKFSDRDIMSVSGQHQL